MTPSARMPTDLEPLIPSQIMAAGQDQEQLAVVTFLARYSNKQRRLVTAGIRPDGARLLAAGGYELLDAWPLDLSFFEPVPCNSTAVLSQDGAS